MYESKRKKNYFSLPIIDEERLISYNTPLILVDNIPIFDVEELLKISPKLIEKIEVHKTPFIMAVRLFIPSSLLPIIIVFAINSLVV